MVHYANPARSGLHKVASLGDGYSIAMEWYQAYPDLFTNKIAYHIYYSTIEKNIFTDGVKYVVIDGSLRANIIDLVPGQEYFFCTRPVEYDPDVITFLSSLPIAYDNLRFYPSSMLRKNMLATDLIVPLLDVEGFTTDGIVKIGVELIEYAAVDTVNNNLIVPPPVAGIPAHLILQSNSQYYLPSPNNVGQGTLASLTLVSTTAPTETWTIRCVNVPDDINLDGYARFEAIGSVSGNPPYIDGNYPIWLSNGAVVSNSILSFSVTCTFPTSGPNFVPGDFFTVQVIDANPAALGGRGFNFTPITIHNTDGYDGYNFWSPIVSEYAIEEDLHWDNVYECQSRFEYPHFPFTILDGYNQVTQDLLSTNLAPADAVNVLFPMYDYAGYHRTDPVQLLDGTCVGSYIGGQMGCIDGYGNYNVFRGFSLQDQNTQRQDVKLTVDGEVACLIRRVQTGRTCNCYLLSSEYPDDRCPFCFVAGTLVRTETGYRPIEEIKIGDKVLSSDGKYHSVVRIFENQYTGRLQSITSSIGTKPILATPDHPFLVMRGSHKMEVKCGPNSGCKAFIAKGDGFGKSTPRQLPSGKYWARAQLKGDRRISLGSFDTKEAAEEAILQYKKDRLIPGHMLDWDDAKNITTGDWLVSKWPDEINDLITIDIPVQFNKNTHLGMKRLGSTQFAVDAEFLWMIGMYLAEGSHNKRGIQFSLHKKETLFSDRLVRFFTKYGYNPVIYLSRKTDGMSVTIHSTTLAQWFPEWLGKLCDSKHIPEELMKLPHDKTWAIINGIYDGDGTKSDHSITQTSEALALQIVELLHRVGERPLIYRPTSSQVLTEKGNIRRPCYCVSWAKETLVHHNRKGRWDFDGQLLAKVKESITTEALYSGNVYNLEIEGDHTYVVQGVVVHNCYGTKFVFGYEQYFNPRYSDGRILVRLSPTAENLKMYEAGMESEFPLDMWTLTMPTIKTRDIIVLFDQDNNESFRYEVGDVTRNKTILGLDGGQLLKTFRIRKTDPAYQVRIFRDTADFPEHIQTSLAMALGTPPHSHDIVINEKVLSVSQINQTTAVSQGHNHPIINGTVMEVFGHTHNIILP